MRILVGSVSFYRVFSTKAAKTNSIINVDFFFAMLLYNAPGMNFYPYFCIVSREYQRL